MTSTARRIAAGDLTQRVSLKTVGKTDDSNEINQLAQAFNQMLDQIEAAFTAQRQSEARTRQFVADASHELRSPLTALSGSVDVLLMQAKNDPVQAEKLLRTMQRELARISRLVIDLLQLTRFDAKNAQTFQFEPTRLDLLAGQVCEDFKINAPDRSIQYEYIHPSGNTEENRGLWIYGDADRLRQILTNLLDNARRYTSTNGQIIVRVFSDPQVVPQQAVLQVVDNGVGIEAKYLTKIFDRFYRVDQARERATGNAGLGLAIVKAIVEAHQGQIKVVSQPGHGTTFTIKFPAVTFEQKISLPELESKQSVH
jgi:two-component system OmpR family sensor kinase